MNIMYVVSNLEKCGPINVLYNIVNEVCKKNECEIVTLSLENEKSMLVDFKGLGVNVTELNLDRNSKRQNYIDELNRVIQIIKPDVVHSHGFRSDRCVNDISKNNDFSHITTLHNFPFSDYPKLYGFIPGIALSVLHLLTINKIQHKVACSFSIANKYKTFRISDISVIQNGVDTDMYKSLTTSKKNEIKKKLGLPINKKIVISTGAIINRKRPIKLLKVFSDFDLGEDIFFLILGDGNLFEKAKKYERENIKLLGSVQNVVEYLQASDVFISNSKAEGLPMAMLEAASTGLVIVGSDIPPHRELRDINIQETLLYQGQSNEVISQCIKKAIRSVNKTAKNNDRSKLSSFNMAERYIAYYRTMKVK